MFDELKLRLGTLFMRSIVAKMIVKKSGYNIDLEINELTAKTKDGKAKIHIDAYLELDNKELEKILKDAGLI